MYNGCFYEMGLEMMKASGPDEENVLLSPVALGLSLAMIKAGARFTTKSQLTTFFRETVEHLPSNVHFTKLVNMLNNTESTCKLQYVSRLYINEGLNIKSHFRYTMADIFKSPVLPVKFSSGNANQIRADINQVICDVTNQKVSNPITSGIFDDNTKLVSISAMYLNGQWAHSFQPENTQYMPFHKTTETVSIEMMHADLMDAEVYNDDYVQMLAMEYNGGKFKFIALLPKKRDGFKAMIKGLNGKRLSAMISNLTPSTVSVYLPKFRMESNFPVNEVLRNCGVTDIFDESLADFDLLANDANDEGIYVSTVVHKAYIEVDESGSKGASSTISNEEKSGEALARCAKQEFKADHPFLFGVLIIDINHNNFPIFLGRFSDVYAI